MPLWKEEYADEGKGKGHMRCLFHLKLPEVMTILHFLKHKCLTLKNVFLIRGKDGGGVREERRSWRIHKVGHMTADDLIFLLKSNSRLV